MNFHAKALLAFIAFHVIVTVGGLLFDQIPQSLGQGANDNDTQLVGAVLWALWCLTLSMGALGMAYLSRAAWRMGLTLWRPSIQAGAIITEWKTIKKYSRQRYWVAFLLRRHWQRLCMSNTVARWILTIFNVPTPAVALCTGFVIDQTSSTWLSCSIERITTIAICPTLLCGNGWEHLRRVSSTVRMLRGYMTVAWQVCPINLKKN